MTAPLGAAQRCAVIGHPAGHSLSPVMHRAGYRHLGLGWTYEAVDVAPGQVDAFIGGLDASWRGLSVTMPHKEAILAHGEPDDLVRLVGAANTLILGSDPIVRNTDVTGFEAACRRAGVLPDNATIAGAGATTRSVLVALARLGCRLVTVLARRPEQAAGLRPLAEAVGITLTQAPLDADPRPTDLVVSTIPGDGLASVAEGLASATACVFDVAYDPWPTPLAAAASRLGLPVLDGIDLLAHQAVDQLRLMTGGSVPVDLLLVAARDEMSRRAVT